MWYPNQVSYTRAKSGKHYVLFTHIKVGVLWKGPRKDISVKSHDLREAAA